MQISQLESGTSIGNRLLNNVNTSIRFAFVMGDVEKTTDGPEELDL